jgi:hypothetical protein
MLPVMTDRAIRSGRRASGGSCFRCGRRGGLCRACPRPAGFRQPECNPGPVRGLRPTDAKHQCDRQHAQKSDPPAQRGEGHRVGAVHEVTRDLSRGAAERARHYRKLFGAIGRNGKSCLYARLPAECRSPFSVTRSSIIDLVGWRSALDTR